MINPNNESSVKLSKIKVDSKKSDSSGTGRLNHKPCISDKTKEQEESELFTDSFNSNNESKLLTRPSAIDCTDEVVIKDWTKTQIYKEFISKGIHLFNSDQYDCLFTEEDNNHIFNLIKQRYENTQSDKGILLSFFTRSLNTFKELMISMGMQNQFNKIREKYKETNIEDTLKLLIRNKILFTARKKLMRIFELVNRYVDIKEEFKED